ncbi:MAG: DUF2892 domain-containing protein [Roseiarcus sp.]
MKTTVGMIDRVVRVILGVALIAFALGFIAPGTPYHWIGWIGIVPLATAAVGSCPLYSILGMSSCPTQKRA